MKFSIGYFAKPRAPGIMPALLATYTGDFDTVDDARKAAIADADNPKIGPVDSITIDPIGERWVKGESLVRTGSGWERRREPEWTPFLSAIWDLAVDPKWIGTINGLATQSTMILQKLMG
jgi:hypothetical protein